MVTPIIPASCELMSRWPNSSVRIHASRLLVIGTTFVLMLALTYFVRRTRTGLIAHDPARAMPGYTLFAPMFGDGTVYLIDMRGEVAHTWRMPYRPGLYGHLLDNGHLLYGGKVMEDLARFEAWARFKGGAVLEADWRGRFKKQRDAIQLLEREIAALDREIKLRPAGVACSTSNVCNDKAAQEQQLQQGKQKLEDMKDELRKAELPDSWAD